MGFSTTSGYEKRLCYSHKVDEGDVQDINFRAIAYNIGSNVGSDPSQEVSLSAEDSEVIDSGFLVLYVIIGVVALILLIFIIVFICSKIKRKYNKVPKEDFERAMKYVSTRPMDINHHINPNSNIMPDPHEHPIVRNLSRNGSNDSNRSGRSLELNRDPSHNTNRPSNRRSFELQLESMNSLHRPPSSIQSIPLPEIPGKEPIYEVLPQDREDTDSTKPVTIPDEDGYLQPKTLQIGGHQDSDDNDEEYLKPTFGKFSRIDSRDLSPPHEQPPPIPIQSYVPVTQQTYSNHEDDKSKSWTDIPVRVSTSKI